MSFRYPSNPVIKRAAPNGREMTLFGRDVLLVGQIFRGAQTLSSLLHRWGFQCHLASGVRAASDLLILRRVDLVLSNTHLTDGTGFRLLEALAGLPVTAILCWPVETGYYWLPAINAGKSCFGLPALRSSEFASVLEEMVKHPSRPSGEHLGTPPSRCA